MTDYIEPEALEPLEGPVEETTFELDGGDEMAIEETEEIEAVEEDAVETTGDALEADAASVADAALEADAAVVNEADEDMSGLIFIDDDEDAPEAEPVDAEAQAAAEAEERAQLMVDMINAPVRTRASTPRWTTPSPPWRRTWMSWPIPRAASSRATAMPSSTPPTMPWNPASTSSPSC